MIANPFRRRQSPERGTLTFLPHGQIILGLPPGMTVTPAQWSDLRDRMVEAAEYHRPMIFGFPVDVRDLRK